MLTPDKPTDAAELFDERARWRADLDKGSPTTMPARERELRTRGRAAAQDAL